MAWTQRSLGAAANSGSLRMPNTISTSAPWAAASRIPLASRTVEPAGAAAEMASRNSGLASGRVRPSMTRMSVGPSSVMVVMPRTYRGRAGRARRAAGPGRRAGPGGGRKLNG